MIQINNNKNITTFNYFRDLFSILSCFKHKTKKSTDVDDLVIVFILMVNIIWLYEF